MLLENAMDETFSEILIFSQNCKFSNCSHTNEKGYAILNAIASGDLSEQRYQNFLKMKKESAFNQMAYAEKRNQDKNFGKLVKETVKNKRR